MATFKLFGRELWLSNLRPYPSGRQLWLAYRGKRWCLDISLLPEREFYITKILTREELADILKRPVEEIDATLGQRAKPTRCACGAPAILDGLCGSDGLKGYCSIGARNG